MSDPYKELDQGLQTFIAEQQIFFVSTAPSSGDGHINVSPKGLDSFRILGPRQVAYLDLTGSGVETIAHLRENRRVTIMFCAFSGRPRIVRLYGQGRAVERADAQWNEHSRRFPEYLSARSLVLVEVERIADSCGYGVPLYEYVGQRSQLTDWAQRKGADGVAQYQSQKNRQSIDGLPGLRHFSHE
jgi:hypothetical protein